VKVCEYECEIKVYEEVPKCKSWLSSPQKLGHVIIEEFKMVKAQSSL